MNDDLKAALTERLAKAFEDKLISMGEDIKGISWFSSTADQHMKNLNLKGC